MMHSEPLLTITVGNINENRKMRENTNAKNKNTAPPENTTLPPKTYAQVVKSNLKRSKESFLEKAH